MRIYIPTSSINADSILSCECVAPASACRVRNFGYQHFELLPELQHYDNVTLAFSKVPVFFINDQLRENYPMIVEIDVNEAELKKFGIVKLNNVEDIDIYATAKPILITPTNARLLFFKREHLDYTYHNCSDSAKCKLFDFFNRRFSYVPREVIGNSLESYVKDLQVSNLQPSFSENDYNRVKGFIWGFGLGAFVSMTPEIARLLKIQKRIYDIISSTKNDGYIPQNLKAELESLDKEYSRLDPVQAEAKTLWNKYLTKICESFDIKADDVPSAINKLLVSLRVENEAKNKFLTENKIQLRKPLSSYPLVSSFGYEQYCTDLERHTQSVIYRNRQGCLNSNTFECLDIDTEKFETVVLSDEDKDNLLFNRFLFKVIWNNLIPSLEELRINRAETAKQVVIVLKNIIEGNGDTWTETPIQAYFDRMRKNISKYEPFNPTDEDSAVLQSITSFVLKGEDFESLKSYLETNAISDYRYAFALWGAMTGYVSIPRTTIESILKTRSNIANLYSIAERALDNIEVNIVDVPSVIIDTPVAETVSPQAPIVQETDGTAIAFRKKVFDFFDVNIFRKRGRSKEQKDKLRAGLERAFQVFGNDSDPIKFVTLLNDFDGWNPKQSAWKTMCAFIAPDYAEQTSIPYTVSKRSVVEPPKRPRLSSRDQGDLFSQPYMEEKPSGLKRFISSIFGKDKDSSNHEPETNAWANYRQMSLLTPGLLVNIINSYFPNLDKQLYIDLEWFVENFSDSYRDKDGNPGRYVSVPKDNFNVLDKLTSYLIRRKDRDNKVEWIRDKYASIPVEEILSLLTSIYGQR